jgi:hypothetical protein
MANEQRREEYRAALRRTLAKHGVAERDFVASLMDEADLHVYLEGVETLTDEIVDALIERGIKREVDRLLDEHQVMHAPHVTPGRNKQDPQWLSFYHPDADLLLTKGMMQRMSHAKRADIRLALSNLPHDWRYSEVERGLLRRYLQERLAAYQDDTERLDEVERRAFGYTD